MHFINGRRHVVDPITKRGQLIVNPSNIVDDRALIARDDGKDAIQLLVKGSGGGRCNIVNGGRRGLGRGVWLHPRSSSTQRDRAVHGA